MHQCSLLYKSVTVLGGLRPALLVEVVRKEIMELNFIEYYVFDDNDGQFHICVFL
jgi:hypothetical protein